MKNMKSFHRADLCFAEDSIGTPQAWSDVVSGYRSIAQGSFGCLIRNLFPCRCLGMTFCKLLGSDTDLTC